MRIELDLRHALDAPVSPPDYDPNLDDVRSIIAHLCDAVSDKGVFIVSGFGQERWPVDSLDLADFLEQLPEALLAIASGREAIIDFYEQGIERTITFSSEGEVYLLSCVSGTCWQPNPPAETMDRRALEEMLSAAKSNFIQFIEKAAPELIDHPWVVSWLQGEPL